MFMSVRMVVGNLRSNSKLAIAKEYMADADEEFAENFEVEYQIQGGSNALESSIQAENVRCLEPVPFRAENAAMGMHALVCETVVDSTSPAEFMPLGFFYKRTASSVFSVCGAGGIRKYRKLR